MKLLLILLIIVLAIYFKKELINLLFEDDKDLASNKKKIAKNREHDNIRVNGYNKKSTSDVWTGKVTAEEQDFSMDLLPMLMKEFIAIDCETTGLSPEQDKIIEISAVHFINGEPLDTFSSFVNANVYISEHVTNINHITNEMIESAPDELTVFKSFLAFLGDGAKGNIILCAHNAGFDIRFLKNTFERIGLNAIFSYIDTLEIAREACLPCENNKLQTLAKYYDLADEQSHRAGEDALLCGKLLMIFIQEEKTKRDKKEAQDIKRKMITINPKNSRENLLDVGVPNETLTNRIEFGNKLRKEGKIDEAIKEFDEARRKGCCHYYLYEWYALAYRKLKDYDNEIDILDEAIMQCEKGFCNGNVEIFRERRDKAIDLLLKQREKSSRKK